MKEFKYSRKDDTQLFSSVNSYIREIHLLASSHGVARAKSVYQYRFSDPTVQTLYEVLIHKMTDRTRAYRYRSAFSKWYQNTYDPDILAKRKFKSYWADKRIKLQQTYGHRWHQRKNRTFYKKKKEFYRKAITGQTFNNSYRGYVFNDSGYRYDTSGYKWRKYRVDYNNNFVSYIDE